MNIINEIVKLTQKNDHKKADVSVTELFKPVQELNIMKKHYKMPDPASDLMMLFGTIGHRILEDGIKQGEKEVYITKNINGKTLSGMVDLITDDEIVDYKFTSVNKASRENEDWIMQLNIYRWMMNSSKPMKIVAVLKNWNKVQATTSPNYPQLPIVEIEIPEISDFEVEDYVLDRLDNMSNNEARCTDSDIWRQADTYNVFRNENKRATKKFDTVEEAMAFIEEKRKSDRKPVSYRIIKKIGNPVRCQFYCAASAWCQQYKDMTEI